MGIVLPILAAAGLLFLMKRPTSSPPGTSTNQRFFVAGRRYLLTWTETPERASMSPAPDQATMQLFLDTIMGADIFRVLSVNSDRDVAVSKSQPMHVVVVVDALRNVAVDLKTIHSGGGPDVSAQDVGPSTPAPSPLPAPAPGVLSPPTPPVAGNTLVLRKQDATAGFGNPIGPPPYGVRPGQAILLWLEPPASGFAYDILAAAPNLTKVADGLAADDTGKPVWQVTYVVHPTADNPTAQYQTDGLAVSMIVAATGLRAQDLDQDFFYGFSVVPQMHATSGEHRTTLGPKGFQQ